MLATRIQGKTLIQRTLFHCQLTCVSRMLRTSWSIFRCLLFFDVCYLLSGIALMVLALADAETVAGGAADKFTLIIAGAGFGLFATVSALCNR